MDVSNQKDKYSYEDLVACGAGELFGKIVSGTFAGDNLSTAIMAKTGGTGMVVDGGMRVTIDGETCNPNERMTYKGVLVEGIPNLAVIFGYINFSWTAKVDIAGEYLCRLLTHLESTGKHVVIPRNTDARTTDASIMNTLNSGYVARGADELPRQGDRAPWYVHHNIRKDRRWLLRDPIDDGVLEFRA